MAEIQFKGITKRYPDGGKSLTYSAGTGNGAGAKAASSAA